MLLFVLTLCGCGEITQEDINGKYFFDTSQKSFYYLFSNDGVEIHDEDNVEKCKNYKLVDNKVSFSTKDMDVNYIYEDGVLYPEKSMKGEIPDEDRFDTQCEFTNVTDSVAVNSVYKFSTDGTLTIENKTNSVLGERNFSEAYYYKRNGNLIEITSSEYDDVEYLYTKDGKLHNRTMIKETE